MLPSIEMHHIYIKVAVQKYFFGGDASFYSNFFWVNQKICDFQKRSIQKYLGQKTISPKKR